MGPLGWLVGLVAVLSARTESAFAILVEVPRVPMAPSAAITANGLELVVVGCMSLGHASSPPCQAPTIGSREQPQARVLPRIGVVARLGFRSISDVRWRTCPNVDGAHVLACTAMGVRAKGFAVLAIVAAAAYATCLFLPMVVLHGGASATGASATDGAATGVVIPAGLRDAALHTAGIAVAIDAGLSAAQAFERRAVAARVLANPGMDETELLALIALHGFPIDEVLAKQGLGEAVSRQLDRHTRALRGASMRPLTPPEQRYATWIMVGGIAVVGLLGVVVWLGWGVASEPWRGGSGYAVLCALALVLAGIGVGAYLGLELALPHLNHELASLAGAEMKAVGVIGAGATIERGMAAYALPIAGGVMLAAALMAAWARPTRVG